MTFLAALFVVIGLTLVAILFAILYPADVVTLFAILYPAEVRRFIFIAILVIGVLVTLVAIVLYPAEGVAPLP